MTFPKWTTKINWILIFILLLAGYFFLFRLTEVPMGLNQDETANAADAWNLSQTGKDFNGNTWPVMLESYGDWASPVLTYFSVPFFYFLGPSVLTTRLPIAILSLFSVVTFYYLIRIVFKSQKLAGIMSLAYVGSPWLITFSRWAIPPSSSFAFTSLVLLFLFLATTTKITWRRYIYFLFLAVFAVILTLSYPTLKLFTILFLGVVFLIYGLKFIRPILPASVIYILGVGYTFWLSYSQPEKYNARFNSVSLLADDSNQITIMYRFFIQYLQYFWPDFLFGLGDGNGMHRAPEFSSVQMFLAFFFYIGFFFLAFLSICWLVGKLTYLITIFLQKKSLKSSIDTKIKEFFNLFDVLKNQPITYWVVIFIAILIWPIAASLTKDPRIFIRVVFGMPLLYLVMALVIQILLKWWESVDWGKNKNYLNKFTLPILKNLPAIILVFLGLFSGLSFSIYYQSDYANFSQGSYNYGRKEALDYILTKNYDKVYLDRDVNLPDYLIHLKIDPKEYQKIPRPERFDKFGKYERIDISKYRDNSYPTVYTVTSNGKNWFFVKEIDSKTAVLVRNQKP